MPVVLVHEYIICPSVCVRTALRQQHRQERSKRTLLRLPRLLVGRRRVGELAEMRVLRQEPPDGRVVGHGGF
jgi:hypothetical protein